MSFETIKKEWKFNLIFFLSILVLFIIETFYESQFSTRYIKIFVNSFAYLGALLIGFSLLTSSVSYIKPEWRSKYKLFKLRRSLGVTGFVFGFTHYLFVLFDFNLNISQTFYSLNPLNNPYIFGYLTLIILTPLALTSNDYLVRKLKRNWKKVHQLVYIAYFFLVFHFLFLSFDKLLRTVSGVSLLIVTFLVLISQFYLWFTKCLKKSFLTKAGVYGIILIIFYISLFFIVLQNYFISN